MDVKIYNHDIKFKFRVSGIVIHEGKVLVDQYGENSYCLPGGYVQIGEDSKSALLREMKEETTLDFKKIDFCGIGENFFINRKGEKTHEIDFYYFVNLKQEDQYENWKTNIIEKEKDCVIEHHFQWLNLKDLKQYDLLPKEIKEVLMKRKKDFHFVEKEIEIL